MIEFILGFIAAVVLCAIVVAYGVYQFFKDFRPMG